MLVSETLNAFLCTPNSTNIFNIFIRILHWTYGYVLIRFQNLQLLLEKMAFRVLLKLLSSKPPTFWNFHEYVCQLLLLICIVNQHVYV